MHSKLLTLLRLTPLLSTTASLTHAYMEYLTSAGIILLAASFAVVYVANKVPVLGGSQMNTRG